MIIAPRSSLGYISWEPVSCEAHDETTSRSGALVWPSSRANTRYGKVKGQRRIWWEGSGAASRLALCLVLILTPSCIAAYIDGLRAGGNGKRSKGWGGRQKGAVALERLWMFEKAACRYWPLNLNGDRNRPMNQSVTAWRDGGVSAPRRPIKRNASRPARPPQQKSARQAGNWLCETPGVFSCSIHLQRSAQICAQI